MQHTQVFGVGEGYAFITPKYFCKELCLYGFLEASEIVDPGCLRRGESMLEKKSGTEKRSEHKRWCWVSDGAVLSNDNCGIWEGEIDPETHIFISLS